MNTTVHQTMQAAERMHCLYTYLAFFPALFYMKPQFEVSRHKNNSEWNAYNPEYFLVALSIILLNSVVTNLRTYHCVITAFMRQGSQQTLDTL
jgi:hypothetical protein